MNLYNFPPTSRYYGLETLKLKLEDGSTVVYLQRRLLPPCDHFAQIQEHVVAAEERLDQVAATYLGDSEAFWRLADSNSAMKPQALMETPGRRLRITLPEGIPANPFSGAG